LRPRRAPARRTGPPHRRRTATLARWIAERAGLADSPAPDPGISSEVKHGKHDDKLVRRAKVGGVRERAQECPSNVVGDGGKLARRLADPRECSTDISKKARRKSGTLAVVPLRGRCDIGLSEWPNDDPARHRHSRSTVELLSEPILNDLPGVARI